MFFFGGVDFRKAEGPFRRDGEAKGKSDKHSEGGRGGDKQ